ncbi:MAG: hypothetical protein RSD88_01050 [Anaerovoracaceae bacterium]
MMKSIIRKTTYEAIYRLLDKVSPIKEDCGKLCNAACCSCGADEDPNDFQLGIYLLPGEEKIFNQTDEWITWNKEPAQNYDFPKSWTGNVYFIRCKTPPICPRDRRPLQCRFFPLSPHLTENGVLQLIIFPGELPYSCPLIKDKMTLNADFIQANYTVWKRLIKDPLIYDLVKMDSDDRSWMDLIVIK